MIITRTPFRVTLGGGGTDLPSFRGRSEALLGCDTNEVTLKGIIDKCFGKI